MLAPVVSITHFAAAIELSEYRTRQLIARFEIPCLDADGIVLVDAGIGERVVRRALGNLAGDAVHRARGGDLAQRVVTPFISTADAKADEPITPPASDFDSENIEEALRAALAEHGGLLSYPLYREWCMTQGRRP